jgi:hypothetical protein
VVFVAKTVVHKGAVVVEFLDAALTVGAVEGPSRLDHPAVEAKVVEIDTLFIG